MLLSIFNLSKTSWLIENLSALLESTKSIVSGSYFNPNLPYKLLSINLEVVRFPLFTAMALSALILILLTVSTNLLNNSLDLYILYP